jgi:DNA-binding beta-propeller fold protein YncE
VTAATTSLKGRLHGGQQGIVGAQVYMYQVGTGGYGAGATSLLNSGFVTTLSDGTFIIPAGSYSCGSGDQIYLYSVGGSPGPTNAANSAATLLSVLGDCGNFGNLPASVQINEVTTVAAAYALSAFASGPTSISGGNSTQAATGIANAAATAANLVDLGLGTARTAPQGNNGTVPQSEINTLADILAACVNVTDATYEGANHNSSACSTLFGAATSDGTPSGTQPSDTATAAINIAQHPGANVGTLYDLATATAPFQPILSGSSGYDGPNDWTIAITYSGGSLHGPHGLAIDSAGYVWVANQARNCISQFNFNGVPGAEDGYDGNGSDPSGCGNETSGGGIAGPSFIAFDPTGQYIWIANYDTLAVLTFATGLGYENYLSDYTGNGGYTGCGLNLASEIALDSSGNAWIANEGYNANSISKFSLGGGCSNYTGGGLAGSTGIAFDSSGHAWLSNGSANVLSEFNLSNGTAANAGYQFCGVQFGSAVAVAGNGIWVANGTSGSLTECKPSTGYSIASASGGGLSSGAIAIDGLGNVWTANPGSNSISEFNSGGTAISANGYQASMSGPSQLAIDPSGNVWVTDYNNGSGNSLTEFIGAAAPVVTPVSVAVKNGQLGSRP